MIKAHNSQNCKPFYGFAFLKIINLFNDTFFGCTRYIATNIMINEPDHLEMIWNEKTVAYFKLTRLEEVR